MGVVLDSMIRGASTGRVPEAWDSQSGLACCSEPKGSKVTHGSCRFSSGLSWYTRGREPESRERQRESRFDGRLHGCPDMQQLSWKSRGFGSGGFDLDIYHVNAKAARSKRSNTISEDILRPKRAESMNSSKKRQCRSPGDPQTSPQKPWESKDGMLRAAHVPVPQLPQPPLLPPPLLLLLLLVFWHNHNRLSLSQVSAKRM